MVKISRLKEISSIKAKPGTGKLPDGGLEDPMPYEGVEVTTDDGLTFPVERPLTKAKVKAAHDAAVDEANHTIDEVSVGDNV